MYFYLNTGTPEIPNFIFETDYFENIDVGEQSSPEFCDIDGDGDYDLFIGCEDGTIWYYENVGDSANYDFQFVTSNYFNIDVGNMSVPRFVDIDGDDDYDLFVGNESGGNSVGFSGDLSFYENIGTSTEPNFQFITGNYLFMDMSGCASPNLVDINGDSLKEILVGLIDGDVAYFENNGTQAEPSFTFIDSSYFDFNIAFQPTMSFGDFDADGDLDLAVTTNGFVGSVCIYENIGTVNNPEYELWMTIITSPDFSFTGIELCDIDADGDLDLFFGDNYDRIRYYENVGTPDNPRFQFRSLNYLNQPYSGDGYILALQIWTMMTIMT